MAKSILKYVKLAMHRVCYNKQQQKLYSISLFSVTARMRATIVKPWPNGLSNRRKFSIRVGFVMACVDLYWPWWWSSTSYASRCSFATVWPPNASRHNTSWSQVICICVKLALFATNTQCVCEPTCESVWPPFASPYASSGFTKPCVLLRVRVWSGA